MTQGLPPGMEQEPHPHHPNHKSAQNGLFCFMDNARACGPDCMSFISQPDAPDYKDQQWANCLLLVNAHRAGKHLTILADCVGKVFQLQKTKAADEARSNQPPVPTVR